MTGPVPLLIFGGKRRIDFTRTLQWLRDERFM